MAKAALNNLSRGFAHALTGTSVMVNTAIAGPTAHKNAMITRK